MKGPSTTIRPAQVSERDALQELQRRASVHEPLYRAQLAAHPDAIELPAEQITAGLVRVAEENGVVVGFAVLLERGATRIDVVANPQALAFYEAVGFNPVGEAQTRFGPAPRMSQSLAC